MSKKDGSFISMNDSRLTHLGQVEMEEDFTCQLYKEALAVCGNSFTRVVYQAIERSENSRSRHN